jgi:hypothetical protein
MRDINQEIETLLKRKEEILKALEFQKNNPAGVVVSQLRYNFWKNNNLLKSDLEYYIAPQEIKEYIEDFQG